MLSPTAFLLLLQLLSITTTSSTPTSSGSLSSSPSPAAAAAAENGPPLITRIAFGSCANQSAPQPIWDAINDFGPQLFIWLGDNIYGDNKRPFRILGKERTVGPWRNVPRFFPSSEQELRSRYQLAKSVPGYSTLSKKAKVIGTWDDHDYGLNDAGKEFRGKNITQRLMLDFLEEAMNSPRRKQAGVYASYLFGPSGKYIKVILLDTRYHRDPMFSDGSILGDSQWTWLEKELLGSPSQITIIASSIQVISNLSAVTGPLFYLESWGQFPKERDRLFDLIAKSKRDGVFFISGDVHFGEINRYDCGEYPLYDVTSSGLTQAVEKAVPQPLAFLVRVAAWLTPTTMRVYGPKCCCRLCTYGQPNFGAIEINWDATPQSMRVEVRDLHGDPVIGVDVLLSDLQSSGINKRDRKLGQYKRHCSLERDLPWLVRHWLAILFYIFIAVLILTLVLLTYTIVSISKQCIRKCKTE